MGRRVTVFTASVIYVAAAAFGAFFAAVGPMRFFYTTFDGVQLTTAMVIGDRVLLRVEGSWPMWLVLFGTIGIFLGLARWLIHGRLKAEPKV